MKTLIIAAHPDDEVLGCGGLITKLSKKGKYVSVLILTDGADTRYPKKMKKILQDSAIKVNKVLGVKKVYFENLPNQQLDTIPLLKIIQTIEIYINKLKPDVVFTHHGGDLNKDHRLIYEATLVATRPLANQIVKKVYSYNIPSSTEWVFATSKKVFLPNVFIDIKKEVDTKINAMKCYKTECRAYPHPRSPEAIKIHAHYWGLVAGIEYAEPFILIRDTIGEI